MGMLRNLVRSFGYAFEGLLYTLFTQRNARIEVACAAAVLGAAAWLHVSRVEWAVLLLTIGIVLSAETMNTAIEKIVDLLSPQIQENAKHAKDVAAGAVLIVSIAAAVIGMVILGPPMWRHLFG